MTLSIEAPNTSKEYTPIIGSANHTAQCLGLCEKEGSHRGEKDHPVIGSNCAVEPFKKKV
eukprot:TCALIF_01000-PA protein Name:"Protein of unknown function" AED:0.77 eAED:0.77 QI:0/0/0/0.5/0/0.5/2/0/59